jgi:Tfp pilus assembly protein FimT
MNTNHFRLSITKSKSLGYTIYEMVITLSIIGVLVAASLPIVYSSVLVHNQDATVLQLKALVKFAQEEAVRGSGASLIICAAEYDTNNGTNSYLNGCASGNSWSEGILTYTDLDSNGSYNSGERLKALRFDGGATISAATSPGGTALNQLIALPSGLLSDANSNEAWTFTISQSKFGQTQSVTLLLNNYGYFCVQSYTGQNNGSTALC